MGERPPRRQSKTYWHIGVGSSPPAADLLDTWRCDHGHFKEEQLAIQCVVCATSLPVRLTRCTAPCTCEAHFCRQALLMGGRSIACAGHVWPHRFFRAMHIAWIDAARGGVDRPPPPPPQCYTNNGRGCLVENRCSGQRDARRVHTTPEVAVALCACRFAGKLPLKAASRLQRIRSQVRSSCVCVALHLHMGMAGTLPPLLRHTRLSLDISAAAWRWGADRSMLGIGAVASRHHGTEQPIALSRSPGASKIE